MAKQEEAPITIRIGEETYGFRVPGHAEIKFYYDTGSESLYEASRNLVMTCALEKQAIKKLIDAKPALVPQIAVNLMRVAGTGLEVKLENFPKPAAGN
ncbi:hypothetical protein CEE36_08355 [candidate division TA06 bacterium B3_TA06]|uniref:Phage tail assembly chaperone protein, E, or 41 or 14 n=1 Tax=candidate division TA06 bacterium B3_TA06 TaxID=2012487 RepID=A0A532V2U6_UNCT6|nr:MAG: hypothetical protein CEE36_08355 [candidate division TA06 bacterium B3_TA06]